LAAGDNSHAEFQHAKKEENANFPFTPFAIVGVSLFIRLLVDFPHQVNSWSSSLTPSYFPELTSVTQLQHDSQILFDFSFLLETRKLVASLIRNFSTR